MVDAELVHEYADMLLQLESIRLSCQMVQHSPSVFIFRNWLNRSILLNECVLSLDKISLEQAKAMVKDSANLAIAEYKKAA